MTPLNLKEVTTYVQKNIGNFHQSRLGSLGKLKLKDVLKRKNPYLFKAKNMQQADQIVRSLLDAHISSNEETIFGDWLEGLAIFINSKVYGGKKSGIEGVDLEFDNAGTRYIVTIKSGPKWGNAPAVKKLDEMFAKATRILKTSGSGLIVESINGCCYGNENGYKLNHKKVCGQAFWELISGDSKLYIELIEPLGFEAKKRNDEFDILFAKKLNIFGKEFLSDFCRQDGTIDWEKIIVMNSGIRPVKIAKPKSVPKPKKVSKVLAQVGKKAIKKK